MKGPILALKKYISYLLYPLAEKAMNRNIRSKVQTIEQDWNLPKSARLARQHQQIYSIVASAAQNVPYYRDLFRKISFKPESLKTDFRYFYDIPLLTKDILQDQKSRMVNETFDKNSLFARKTGGSTGITTTIYYDQTALDWTAAANLFAHRFTDRTRIDREIHILSEPLRAKPGLDFWISKLKEWALNRRNLYTSYFDSESLRNILKIIVKENAFLVQSNPSTLYAIAQTVAQSFEKPIFKALESTGEQLYPKQCSLIEEKLGCKVYNRYGTAEFGVTAHSQDNPHLLNIIDYLVLHETTDLGNGLEEILGTTTTNYAMPLIRYRTGDIGKINASNEHDQIVGLQGRVHDTIQIQSKIIHTQHFQDLFERLGDIYEFQFVARKDNSLELLIVPEPGINLETLSKRLLEHIPSEVKIKFVDFDHLFRVGWRDKFKHLVRE